jgi:hypothetical protein
MKISFPKQESKKIISAIKKAMGDRALSEMVDLSIEKSQMIITISKMGTSTLTFSKKDEDERVFFVMTSEKIAFTHRAFKGEVTEALAKIVKKAGGTIEEA